MSVERQAGPWYEVLTLDDIPFAGTKKIKNNSTSKERFI